MGSKVIECNNRSTFTNCVSFFSGPTSRCFLNSKKGRSLSEGLDLTPLEASFYGFYKDKHRKFCAILTEILPR